jgi:hypothetical protein
MAVEGQGEALDGQDTPHRSRRGKITKQERLAAIILVVVEINLDLTATESDPFLTRKSVSSA